MKSTAAILAAAMFVGDRTTASPLLAGLAAVVSGETMDRLCPSYDQMNCVKALKKTQSTNRSQQTTWPRHFFHHHQTPAFTGVKIHGVMTNTAQ